MRFPQFAETSLWACRVGTSCHMLQRAKKFTEPVALSSASPGNFRPSALRLLPTALRSDFDLLALRARCKGKPMRSDMPRQEGRALEKGALCECDLGKSCGFHAARSRSARRRTRRARVAPRSALAIRRVITITEVRAVDLVVALGGGTTTVASPAGLRTFLRQLSITSITVQPRRNPRSGGLGLLGRG
jgi:hypothetical protein